MPVLSGASDASFLQPACAVQSGIARGSRRAQDVPDPLGAGNGQFGFRPDVREGTVASAFKQTSVAWIPRAIAARRRGMGEREPRGAAAGAAFNRSRRSAYEPSPDPQRPPEPRNEGSPAEIRARISEPVTERGEVHADSNHSTTMARSLGASMARGLGILLIMMTLSEIAAPRASPRPATQRAASPIETSPRARPPAGRAARAVAAAAGRHGEH